MPLPEPDPRHFLAAEGWLELGNVEECFNELEEISPMCKTHRLALELRVKMYAQAEKWDHVEPIAETLARIIPGRTTERRSLGLGGVHPSRTEPPWASA